MSICLRRREFIAALGGAAAWPLAVSAQQTKPTIGWLTGALPPRDFIDAFRRGLAEVGFLEGRDVTVEYHTTEGHIEWLPALAADLVLRRVAVILAGTTVSALSTKAVTPPAIWNRTASASAPSCFSTSSASTIIPHESARWPAGRAIRRH